MQKCYLALGCFWKPEENFKNKPGIIETEVGYAGGDKLGVTYEEVCRGKTGHAETVKLTFDEKVISFEKILAIKGIYVLVKKEYNILIILFSGIDVSRTIRAPSGFKTLKLSPRPFSKSGKFRTPKPMVMRSKKLSL